MSVTNHRHDAAQVHHDVAVLQLRYPSVKLGHSARKLCFGDGVESVRVTTGQFAGEVLQVFLPGCFAEILGRSRVEDRARWTGSN